MKAISFLLTSNLPSKADTVHGLGEFYQAFQEDPALKESRVHSWRNLFLKDILLFLYLFVCFKGRIKPLPDIWNPKGIIFFSINLCFTVTNFLLHTKVIFFSMSIDSNLKICTTFFLVAIQIRIDFYALTRLQLGSTLGTLYFETMSR